MTGNLCLTRKPIKEVAEELDLRRGMFARLDREHSYYQEGNF